MDRWMTLAASNSVLVAMHAMNEDVLCHGDICPSRRCIHTTSLTHKYTSTLTLDACSMFIFLAVASE
jgi:hypothetical protein